MELDRGGPGGSNHLSNPSLSDTNMPMHESFDHSLRRAMAALGRLIEAIIGGARKATVQVGSRGGVQPLLSLESQLAPDRIKDLVESAVGRVISGAMPNMEGGLALDIGEGPNFFASKMLGSRAKMAVGVEIRPAMDARQGDASRGFFIQGQPSQLPFPANRFIFVIGRLAAANQGDVPRAAMEIGRVMAPGGQGVIIDFHPYGLYEKRGAGRSRSSESSLRRFEDYYKVCRSAGLRVVNVKETFIDDELRPIFKEDEIGTYRMLKGTPFIAFFFVYKPKRK
jgi:SAM-dependent methyltransferase